MKRMMNSANNYFIAPSLLAADAARLGDEATAVLAAGADMIHLDVMDNHYVPNLTFGPLICQALRKFGVTAPIDVHLMARPVDRLISEFAASGASYITFHPEASDHIDRSLALIRDSGAKAGLAFNPATPLSYLKYVLPKVDMLLLMTVNPGFGGQVFIPDMLTKIQEARTLVNLAKLPIRIAVDGGINVTNIASVANAGADTFIAGSAIFNSTDYAQTISALRSKLNHATQK